MASGRVETGPVRFGDDWAGVFIRGDEALGLALALDQVVPEVYEHEDVNVQIAAINLNDLAGLLRSCREPCEARQIGLARATEPTPSSLDREIL